MASAVDVCMAFLRENPSGLEMIVDRASSNLNLQVGQVSALRQAIVERATKEGIQLQEPTDRWDRVSDKLAQGKLRLYADNVLVRLTDTQTEIAPGSCIIAPQNARKWRSKELALLGVVVAVGPGYYPDVRMKPARKENRAHWDVSPVKSASSIVPCTVKVGELAVLESQLSGDVWPLREGEHRLVREAEILAVIEP